MPKATQNVQSVQRAVEILEFVSDAPRTQTEVAEHINVHRSTALRLLETLTEGGLTRRNERGQYSVGYRLAGLAAHALDQFSLRNLAHESLEQLGASCGHTIHLAELTGNRIVYADKIDPIRSVRLYSQIGQTVPFHTSGVAKAILAFQPPTFVDDVLAGYEFTIHTPNTLPDAQSLKSQLDEIRTRGWAVDDAEFEDFINCVAAPVRDSSSRVVAAVSITALKAKANLEQLEELIPELLATTETISKELGWRP
ncbi:MULTISPECIES: IclR family transcriptional regulator [unclassified Cryobacterium]|uniref:IclR family transcriptional regulator n=1 Tax=unclassified Cryobacterium TaxID=2649013 RepID=UPI001069A744|nr:MULTISPECIES: IclR family transcriptional regulator [unclassified Cryobacterium]MDY7529747.1 IclR family transcriptional regulator [Cryobacterium sp. 10C2]MDY7558123.1 IclR family transcriptional regulator [Cryobacterium sp. 10C3]MEB0202812.1 IclR family transcriptional regulator [Cryobacterium sp. 5I3]MEB0289491.1 IclR family transcriptional regulator [Cryobacterium sp. 10C2]TFC04412.1 IclR family transcriptional regulator [Cryobacterium sp. MDB2-33-2]